MNVALKVFWKNPLSVNPQHENPMILRVPFGAMIPFHLTSGGGNIYSVNGYTGPVIHLSYADVAAESAANAQTQYSLINQALNTKVDGSEINTELAQYSKTSAMQAADAVVLQQAYAYSNDASIEIASFYDHALEQKADLVGGVIPTSQLPAIAITQFLGDVADEAAMLALQGQSGDWCIRSDTGSTYVVTVTSTSGSLSDWVALPQVASGGVSSINGQSGTVVLGYADVNADAAGTAAGIQTTLQNQINTKVDALTLSQSLALKADKSITVGAGNGLVGGGDLSANRMLGLADTGVVAGTYGDANQAGHFLVGTDGRIISATNVPLAPDWAAIGSTPTTLNGYGIIDAVNTDTVVTTATANKLLKLDTNARLPADISGNAASSNQLATARTISLSGALTGSSTFDGTANISIMGTLADSGVSAGAYPKVTVNAKGLVTAGASLSSSDIPGLDWSKISTGKPTTLSGYGIVDAVNISDMVATATANKLLKLDASAKLPADLTGNAATATKLATARSIALSGALTGSSSFDGSANLSIAATLADSGVSAGSYPKVTVNAKGLVTAASSLTATDIPSLDWTKIGSGKPTTLSGYGISDAQAASAALSSIAGLTTAADQMIYTTAANTYAVLGTTLFGRSLLSGVTAAAARSTLGLGTAAVANIGTGSGMLMNVGSFGLGGLTVDFMATAGSGGFNTPIGKNQFLRYSAATENNPSPLIGNSGTGLHIARAADGNNDVQFAFDTTGRIGLRANTSGTWSAWNSVYSSNNPIAYNTTTATAANVVVTSTGELQRSTSSEKYKYAIEPMDLWRAEALVYGAQAINYKSACASDSQDHSFYGFSAEQIAGIDPRFVFWKTHDYVLVGEGDEAHMEAVELPTAEVESVFYDRMVAPLFLCVQSLNQKIAQLEQRVAELEKP